MLKYVRNELFVEKVPVSKLAKKFGTPIYIYSQKNWNLTLMHIKPVLKVLIPLFVMQ